MKRLFTATVLLTAFAAGASAGSLPKPIKLVDRMKVSDLTHFVRGTSEGRGGGGWLSAPAEARQEKQKPETKPGEKPAAQPARAD